MSMQAIVLKIRLYGEAVLRRRAKAVKILTDADRELFQEMAQVMRAAGGIGLAAPQVGISRQFLLVDVGEGLTILINPRITKKSGSCVLEEGCLSLPGIYVKVRRAKCVTITGLNEFKEKITICASDLMARALQHEMDHLRGRLIIDYANLFERIKLKKKLKTFLRKAKDGMPQQEKE